MTSRCPECGNDSLVEKSGVYETSFIDRKGSKQDLHVPELTWLECNECGEVVLEDAAMERIEQEKRRALQLLSPDDFVRLRSSAGLSQVEMAELIGAGGKSYCRWESGAYVQSETVDRYMRLLISEPRNLDILRGIKRQKNREWVPDPEHLRSLFPDIGNLGVAVRRAELFTQSFIAGEIQTSLELQEQ
jgi:putative zinc finger/helix-turn-helix YgiT family protein